MFLYFVSPIFCFMISYIAQAFDPVTFFDTLPEFLEFDATFGGRLAIVPTKKSMNSSSVIISSAWSRGDAKKNEKDRVKMFKELEARLQRERQLEKLRGEMVLQKHLSGKGKRRKITNPDGVVSYQWAHERKK